MLDQGVQSPDADSDSQKQRLIVAQVLLLPARGF